MSQVKELNYTRDEINALLAKAGLVSNPNLLINPDFKINQRGLTEYDMQIGYGIDMWKMGSAGASVVKPVEDGVQIDVNLVTATHYINYIQHMEIEPWMAGKTFTASIQTATEFTEADDFRIRAATTQTTTFGGPYGINLTQRILGKTATLTFTLPEDISTHPYLAITFNRGSGFIYTKEGIVINYIKLEEGSIGTPFIAPDETLERLKCQAYFYKPPNVYAGNVLLCRGGASLVGGIRFPVRMKTAPSVVLKKVFGNNNVVTEITSANQAKYSDGLTSFYSISPTLVDGVYYQVEYEASCEPT